MRRVFLKAKWNLFDWTIKDNFRHNLEIDEKFIAKFELRIPDGSTAIRLDIGLSYHAPQSAAWLMKNSKLFVVGIEANRFNVARLIKYGLWYFDGTAKKRRNLDANFQLYYCAIANIQQPCYLDFYNLHGDPGTSSLLKPTSYFLKQYQYKLHKISKVPAIPLSLILERVPIDRFPVIELVKIDTQGSDLDVIKSMKSSLNRICCLQVEIATFGQYEKAASTNSIVEYLESNNFYKLEILTWYNGKPLDILFANKKFDYLAKKILTELKGGL